MAIICHAAILSRHLTPFSHLYFGLHLPLPLTALSSHHPLFLPTSINFSLFPMASNNKQFVVRYYECRHNYAARSMGHVLDGCDEFYPTDAPNTPQALICAACHCHRNFHRRVEVEIQNGVEIHHPAHATPLVITDSPPPQYSVRPRAQIVEALENNNGDDAEKETEGEELQVAELERKDPSSSSSPVKMKLNPYQIRATIQDDVKMEESPHTKNVHHFNLINAQMCNSPGTKSIMAMATPIWGYINKNDGGNKRKKTGDELVAEDDGKDQAEILATKLEGSLNMRSQEKKIKKEKV